MDFTVISQYFNSDTMGSSPNCAKTTNAISGMAPRFEVPNSAVDMDSWAELACYPRSSFYPLISRSIECLRSVHFVLLSHLLGMYPLQSSQLMPMHYQRDVHPRLADLNKLLRYFLGGLRPTQTARQLLSPLSLISTG